MFFLNIAEQCHDYFPTRRAGFPLQKLIFIAIVFSLTISVWATGTDRSRKVNQNKSKSKILLYLPLDERFTTRDLFLSFAEITPYQVITPDKTMLPQKKRLPEMKALIDWTLKTAERADAAIISADMLVYGGLIASRTSSETDAEASARINVLEEIRRRNPRLPIFVSTTVMRMPQYSSSDEEPDYYAKYGREIFLFSQHSHRYEALKNLEDKIAAENYKNKISAEALEDYLKRRKRNFNINQKLIQLVSRNVIDRLVITLDDNAEYGFFKQEAAELEKLSAAIGDRVAVYPGADEAQLPLLSRLALNKKRIPVYIAYRFPEARRLIPAFEGQALEESVRQQVLAAGGIIVNAAKKAACIIYVNNFQEKQSFAGSQIGLSSGEKIQLENLLKKSGISREKEKVYILADNRYYNGSDTQFIESIFSGGISPDQIAYAGWNTSGNTLGTAVAMGFLRFQISNARLEQYKRLLWARFIEDWAYMVEGREELKRDMKLQNVNSFAGTALETDYESRMKTFLNLKANIINRFLRTNYSVKRVYFPWHRHFEIGFEIESNN